MSGGCMPRVSRSSGHECVGQATEQIGLRTSCREGETDAASGFDDTGCDFEKSEPDGRELGRSQVARLRNGVAHGEDEPIGGGVEDEAHLVGKRRAAACRVAGLGVAAHHGLVVERTLGSNRVGDLESVAVV